MIWLVVYDVHDGSRRRMGKGRASGVRKGGRYVCSCQCPGMILLEWEGNGK